MVATRKNPDIKALYERLLAADKTKMCALGAAMRIGGLSQAAECSSSILIPTSFTGVNQIIDARTSIFCTCQNGPRAANYNHELMQRGAF